MTTPLPHQVLPESIEFYNYKIEKDQVISFHDDTRIGSPYSIPDNWIRVSCIDDSQFKGQYRTLLSNPSYFDLQEFNEWKKENIFGRLYVSDNFIFFERDVDAMMFQLSKSIFIKG